MKTETKYLLSSFVHGIATSASLGIAVSGVAAMFMDGKDGKKHPVAGAFTALLGAGMTAASIKSNLNEEDLYSDLLIKEMMDAEEDDDDDDDEDGDSGVKISPSFQKFLDSMREGGTPNIDKAIVEKKADDLQTAAKEYLDGFDSIISKADKFKSGTPITSTTEEILQHNNEQFRQEILKLHEENERLRRMLEAHMKAEIGGEKLDDGDSDVAKDDESPYI